MIMLNCVTNNTYPLSEAIKKTNEIIVILNQESQLLNQILSSIKDKESLIELKSLIGY